MKKGDIMYKLTEGLKKTLNPVIKNLKLIPEPPPDLTIDEWADKYRVLSSEASAEPGPWRTSRFPFMRKIMEVIPAKEDE